MLRIERASNSHTTLRHAVLRGKVPHALVASPFYEDYVGAARLEKHGAKRWRKHVAKVVAHLTGALSPDDVLLGGGNVEKLKELPPGCRAGDNANACLGGFRLWEAAQ